MWTLLRGSQAMFWAKDEDDLLILINISRWEISR